MKDKTTAVFQNQINEFTKQFPIEEGLPGWVHGWPKILTNLRSDVIIFNAFLKLHKTGNYSLPTDCVITPNRKMKKPSKKMKRKKTPSKKRKKTPSKKMKKKKTPSKKKLKRYLKKSNSD